MFAFVVWNLWRARNSHIFEDKIPSPSKIVQNFVRQQTEFHNSAPNGARLKGRDPPPVRWLPPPLDSLKLNSDATIFKDGMFGLGFVVRNDQGHAVLAGSKRCGRRVATRWLKLLPCDLA